ncbi:VOC family protein [Actinomadura sp. CNU-125]|uniref:VOC family protein n=1 Tax=Actinomadura sp. CNU-125 TaxID=1904961 RepID=UPI00117865B1
MGHRRRQRPARPQPHPHGPRPAHHGRRIRRADEEAHRQRRPRRRAFHTDDCRADYERLSAAGVEFVQKPERRPYGVEAVFRDDSGCWYSLTQPSERLDESADWGDCVS